MRVPACPVSFESVKIIRSSSAADTGPKCGHQSVSEVKNRQVKRVRTGVINLIHDYL